MSRITPSIVFFLSLFCFNSAYTQGPLDGYFKGNRVLDVVLAGGFQTANNYFTVKGDVDDYTRFLGMGSLFAEYGLNEKVDLVASLPFIGDKFQDVGLYAKFKMVEARISGRPFVIVPGIGVSTPVSDYNTQSTNSIGQAATQFHGHLIGQTTLFGNVSMQIQGAYHYALDPVPSAITASGKLIYSKDSWYLDAWYEFQQGQGDINYQTPQIGTFREFSVDHHKIGGVIYKGLQNNWGMFVNASTVVDGLNTFNTTVVMVGFNKKINFLDRQIKQYKAELAKSSPRAKFY